MYGVDLYRRVRLACHREGLSRREASRQFGIDRKTVAKILLHSEPPGYRRRQPPKRPKLAPFTDIIDGILEEDRTDTAYRITENGPVLRRPLDLFCSAVDTYNSGESPSAPSTLSPTCPMNAEIVAGSRSDIRRSRPNLPNSARRSKGLPIFEASSHGNRPENPVLVPYLYVAVISEAYCPEVDGGHHPLTGRRLNHLSSQEPHCQAITLSAKITTVDVHPIGSCPRTSCRSCWSLCYLWVGGLLLRWPRFVGLNRTGFGGGSNS